MKKVWPFEYNRSSSLFAPEAGNLRLEKFSVDARCSFSIERSLPVLKAAEIKRNTDTEIKFGYTCCINFLSQLIFVFLLFLGMVMYAKEVETEKKKKEKLPEIETTTSFTFLLILILSLSLFYLFFIFFCFLRKRIMLKVIMEKLRRWSRNEI